MNRNEASLIEPDDAAQDSLLGWARQHNEVVLANALAIVAQDLRGPLANLSALIELIAAYGHREALDRARPHMPDARDAIARLDGLLSAFLERTRATREPLGFEPSLVDLATVLKEAVWRNRPVAESRGVEIDFAGTAPVTIWGDRALLLEAVDHLVAHAANHARVDATVSCRVSRDRTHAVIRIAVDRSEAASVPFDRLLRPFAPSAAAASMRADRLELWTLRLIVERHGGTVSTMDRGPGLVFMLRLPTGIL